MLAAIGWAGVEVSACPGLDGLGWCGGVCMLASVMIVKLGPPSLFQRKPRFLAQVGKVLGLGKPRVLSTSWQGFRARKTQGS